MCSSVAGVLPVTRFDGRADRRRHARARGRSAPAPTASASSPAADAGSVAGGGPGRPGELAAGARLVAHASTSCARRRSRVSGRFALITQCVASRR